MDILPKIMAAAAPSTTTTFAFAKAPPNINAQVERAATAFMRDNGPPPTDMSTRTIGLSGVVVV